jgi:hypothetical protein
MSNYEKLQLLYRQRQQAPKYPVADGDSEADFAAKFLLFVHSVPFRLLATEQELSEIYGYSDHFGVDFEARWQNWTDAERLSMLGILSEYQRLRLLQAQFEAQQRELADLDLTIRDRTQILSATYAEAIDLWHEKLSARDFGLPEFAQNQLPAQLALPFETDCVPRRTRSGAFGTFSFEVTAEARAAASVGASEIADKLLSEMAEREIQEAERRFGERVRWLIRLSKQQRTAVIYRMVGKSRAEIAQILQISPHSVKTHLQRADDIWKDWFSKLEPAPLRKRRRKQEAEAACPAR